MKALGLVLTGILAVLAVTVAPRRTERNVEAMRRALPGNPHARVALYRRFLLGGLLLVAIAVAVVAASGTSARDAGLTWPPYAWDRAVPVAVAGFAAFILVMLLAAAVSGQHEVDPRARILLPTTPAERRLWPAVAVMAGVSEEALYRGVLVLNAHALLPGVRPALLAAVAAALFAVGHRYQGWLGMLGSGLLGGVFGAVAVATASLYAAVALHAFWDVLVGLRAPRPESA